jgi:hypothetical protein
MPGSIGFQSVPGASVAASEILRGPARRSRYGASDRRQESAACCRSACVIVTCISFSASANVDAETSGPEPVPVPNVGGAPGVAGAVCAGASTPGALFAGSRGHEHTEWRADQKLTTGVHVGTPGYCDCDLSAA